MTPENKKLLVRVKKARNFPTGTCPASRHAAMIGEFLARDKPYPMLQEEPEHVAGTILSVVASLWESRAEIERLKGANRQAIEYVDETRALRARVAELEKALQNAHDNPHQCRAIIRPVLDGHRSKETG